MQKEMEAWMIWAEKCGNSLVDMGSSFVGGEKLTKSGSAPCGDFVIAYSILQAEDINGAKDLLKEHPHLQWTDGCEIEVHEIREMH